MSGLDTLLPERPKGVPAGARYFPSGPDFAALEEHVKAHTGRGYLRCSVPFLFWSFHGVMLQSAHHRGLSVNRPSWSMGRCLLWSDESYPVPGVWVWTLADERASGETPRDHKRFTAADVVDRVLGGES